MAVGKPRGRFAEVLLVIARSGNEEAIRLVRQQASPGRSMGHGSAKGSPCRKTEKHAVAPQLVSP